MLGHFLNFLLYPFISSWNPHTWGAILRFPCKSLDKSSDCVDFINPWIYWIYLSTSNFSNFLIHLHLSSNLVIQIFGTKSWDLFIKSLCIPGSFAIYSEKIHIGQKFNFNFNFNLIVHICWFDCFWSSRDHTEPVKSNFSIKFNQINWYFFCPNQIPFFSELLFSLQYGLIKSFIIYFSTYLNGIIFNSILSSL